MSKLIIKNESGLSDYQALKMVVDSVKEKEKIKEFRFKGSDYGVYEHGNTATRIFTVTNLTETLEVIARVGDL